MIGGSFAPPLNVGKLAAYKSKIESCDDPQIKEVLLKLHKMVEVFNETPSSSLDGVPHALRGTIIPLEEQEVKRIWDYVPWDYEIEAYKILLERLPNGELRNAAFHLLWFAVELEKDREPITNDRI